MDTPTFRALYPEFASTTTYPDVMLTQWLAVGTMMLNGPRWAEALDLGLGLFMAHNITLGALNAKAASKGAVPGQQLGPLSSKSAGAVSASYDISSGIEPGAGHWNLTTYGTRFIQLAGWMGAGPAVA